MKKIITLALASMFVSSALAATTVEDFAADPAQNGWSVFGNTNLFQWNSTNENLAVTWDSLTTNSYFYKPLGRTFTKVDSFCVQFDLNIADTMADGYFEMAIGLCNIAQATSPDFSRANFASPNLVEFDYFPDGPNSYGPSLDLTLIDTHTNLAFAYDTSQPLATNVTYRILLVHPAGASTVTGMICTNGDPFTTFPVALNYGVDDFQVDTLAVLNYTTLDDPYDTLLAHGVVDNIALASPLPVERLTVSAAGAVQFASDTHWNYTLQRTTDFKTWTNASAAAAGNGTNLVLSDSNPPSDGAFYRVKAQLQ